MRHQINFVQTLVVAIALAGLVSLAACNKGHDNGVAGTGGGDPQIADVPSPTINGCFQNARSSTWWNQYNVQPYPMNGAGPQNYQSSFNQGFCGCPAGTMPTCSGQGLLCMPVAHMNWNVATWSWNGRQNAGPGGGQFNPGYKCVNPYTSYDRFHRRGGGRSQNGRGFFWASVYSESGDVPHGGPGPHPMPPQSPSQPPPQEPLPQQPVPQLPNPQPAQLPQGGVCTGSVAQMCTPNPAIPTTPGQMYCQPLQPGNFSGPGIWVQL